MDGHPDFPGDPAKQIQNHQRRRATALTLTRSRSTSPFSRLPIAGWCHASNLGASQRLWRRRSAPECLIGGQVRGSGRRRSRRSGTTHPTEPASDRRVHVPCATSRRTFHEGARPPLTALPSRPWAAPAPIRRDPAWPRAWIVQRVPFIARPSLDALTAQHRYPARYLLKKDRHTRAIRNDGIGQPGSVTRRRILDPSHGLIYVASRSLLPSSESFDLKHDHFTHTLLLVRWLRGVACLLACLPNWKTGGSPC